MIRSLNILLILILLSCCESKVVQNEIPSSNNQSLPGIRLIVLGTIQDAGSPHMACKKSCCAELFIQPNPNRKVVSIGIIDEEHQETYLLEASPDFRSQCKNLKNMASWDASETPSGIFLTHAHIGHYTGLMYLGRESMNAESVPVYAMPRMKSYLENNGPWQQLIQLKNIELVEMQNDSAIILSKSLSILPIQVPHRDEYSETVGFKIIGTNKSALFIPDINKWSVWNELGHEILKEIKQVDYAFLDATFFDGEEINSRDISEIPHPFIIESMDLFQDLDDHEKNKIYFIHFNHTNPVLNKNSKAYRMVEEWGFHLSEFMQEFDL